MFDVNSVCADVAILDKERAEILVTPRRRKVAIVGFATNTLNLVPWNDPEFEIWGLNQGYLHMYRRADRWFEMHNHETTADVRDPQYLSWLSACPIPIYMLETRPEVPSSVRFPIEKAIEWLGMDYFMSSIAYMMAIAGMEGFEEVHLYGINLAIGDEYFYEKPNAEFILGFMKAKGIKIVIPKASSLLKQYARYGYALDARPHNSLKVLIGSRINEYHEREKALLRDMSIVEGARREGEALQQIFEGLDHGADIVLMPAPAAATPATSG